MTQVYVVTIEEEASGLFSAHVMKPMDFGEVDALWVDDESAFERASTAWDAAKDALAAIMPEPDDAT